MYLPHSMQSLIRCLNNSQLLQLYKHTLKEIFTSLTLNVSLCAAINEAIQVRTIPVIDRAFNCIGKCKFKKTKEILKDDIDRCSELAERLRRLERLRKEVSR